MSLASWPESRPVKNLSPSSFQVMRACQLRSAFGQSGRPPSHEHPAVRLGRVCHGVLDRLVTSGDIHRKDLQTAVDAAWRDEVQAEARAAEAAGEPEPSPERWPGYQLKKARLRRVAKEIAEMTRNLGPDDVLTEQELTGAGGRLRGFADLVVRTPELHFIVDYKTGAVLEPGTDVPRASYVQQLQLYAFLETEVSGSWPTEAVLLPLHGDAVRLQVDPAACEQLASEAISTLEAFNAACPTQPANASVATCPMCPHAPRCPAFWEACNTEWAESVLAARGTLIRSFLAPLGGVSWTLSVVEGSLQSDQEILIRNVNPAAHRNAEGVTNGDDLALVGLKTDGDSAYRLPPGGRFAYAH